MLYASIYLDSALLGTDRASRQVNIKMSSVNFNLIKEIQFRTRYLKSICSHANRLAIRLKEGFPKCSLSRFEILYSIISHMHAHTQANNCSPRAPLGANNTRVEFLSMRSYKQK